ncbi:MAG: DNA polymerase/3'-5' exonuclease PolX [Trueperaceae bacterium]|nr:DNA polymerase/3'-5' exonuclease PolX [Trueperaceae bacterium]
MASNGRIAHDLDEIADLLELEGANPFRVRAYRNAARTVRDHPQPLRDMARQGEDLRALKGIGNDIAAQIAAKLEGGEMDALLELRERVPTGLLEVTRVQGVGPKRARRLHAELGVDGLDALERAARDGRIAALSGFGPTSQAKILDGVASARQAATRRRRAVAARALAPLLAWLHDAPATERVEVGGSFRRGRDTVRDLDLLAVSDAPEAVMAHVRDYEEVETVLAAGPDKTRLVLVGGLQVDLRVVPEASFGAAWIYFTGSKAHNVRLRGRAGEMGASLNEYGLHASDGEAPAADARDEAAVYAALGLAWVPPELREDRGEIEAAAEGTLPELIEVGDLRSDLHLHTDWSDGRDALGTMLQAAGDRGLRAVAVTDHSPALAMTGGLDRAKLERQWQALDELEPVASGLEVLRGMEVDVLADGSLDMDDDMLDRMDVVIASVHGRLDLPEAEQTRRVLRALAHPAVNVLGHPTGRMLGRREGMALDLDAVTRAAQRYGVALEINANPARLDLDDVWARRARQVGAWIAVNTDAHAAADLDLAEHGVLQARRAWLRAEDVINTWPLPRLRRFLAKQDVRD